MKPDKWMEKITTTPEYITPAQAEEWLEAHYKRVASGKFKQRNVAASTMDRYVSDMRCDGWMLDPNPVVFDVNDDLLNGQHRLSAVLKSGKTVPLMISRGWPAETIDCIDRGRGRSVASQMALHGIANANKVSAAVSAVCRIRTSGETAPVSYAASLYVLDTLGLRPHIERILNMSAKIGGRFIGPIAYYMTAHPQKGADFASQVINIEAEKNTPPWIFLRYQRDNPGVKQAQYIRALCACLKAWDNGETVTYIRPGPAACHWLARKNVKLRDSLTYILNLGPAVEEAGEEAT